MKRFKAYVLIGLSYVIACAAAWFVFTAIVPDADELFRVILGLFAADAAATVVVWLFGLIFKNSSFYDPYWSLMPWLILLALMCRFNLWSGTNFLLFAAMGVWSWRLTVNWAYTCENIRTQDWRYVKFKQENKAFLWHVINFFGINMMPTVLVFLALIPAIVTVLANAAFNPWALMGAAVILIGTLLELVADIQMHRFRKSGADKDSVLDAGLWRYSRHPNYLGEITVWFGVFFIMLAVAAERWYFGAGAVLIFCLFYFISIPMMEKRQKAKRTGYAPYAKATSKLLLLPRRKQK